MLRGATLPPAFFPAAAFLLWLALFFGYLPVLASDLDFPRQVLAGHLLVGNVVLVLVWFLCGRAAFAVAAALAAGLAGYVMLAIGEPGLLVEAAALVLLYFWLEHLSRTIENEKLLHLVGREKVQATLNLARKALGEKEHFLSALGRKLERLRYLRQFSDHLKAKTNLREVTRIVTEEVAKLLPAADLVLLYVIDPKTQELGLVQHASRDARLEAREKKGDEHDQWVLRRAQPLLIEDVKNDFRFSFGVQSEPDFRSVAIVPLVSERKVFAVLHLQAVRPAAFHTDDLRFLDIAGDLSGVSLRNVLLYEKTKELSIIDSLTECYLYRYVQERLAEEIRRSLRHRVPFAVLMGDIDHFKKYNDELGHTAGDAVLKGIADILRAVVGETGIVGRYGGEEFIVILPQKGAKEAFDIAEVIRRRVGERDFNLRREKRNVTISFGVSVFPEHGSTKEEILWKADKHLYEAKRRGRNQTFAGA